MTDYGKDISCTDALLTGRYATGLRLVAEAMYRRLITRKGELLDDPDYGLRLADYLGSTTTAAEMARLPTIIQQELTKDGRVISVDATIAEITAGPDREWTVEIEAYTDEGSFALVLSVDDVTTSLLGVS